MSGFLLVIVDSMTRREREQGHVHVRTGLLSSGHDSGQTCSVRPDSGKIVFAPVQYWV
jgi:hypothetical protein